jgi:transposase
MYTMREIVNGIRYLERTGVGWRNLPPDLPHWRSCYGDFRQWKSGEIFASTTEEMRPQLRILLGRAPEPSVAILDSQSVRTD